LLVLEILPGCREGDSDAQPMSLASILTSACALQKLILVMRGISRAYASRPRTNGRWSSRLTQV